MALRDEIAYDDPDLGYERLANDPEAWLAQVRLPSNERSPWFDRGRYPSSTVRDHFLDPEILLTPETLREVLRALLPTGTGPLGSDHSILLTQSELLAQRAAEGTSTEYERRLRAAALARISVAAPVPDLTWVIDLAFDNPDAAASVVRSYLWVHFPYVGDALVDGLYQFMETIRARFGRSSSSAESLTALRSIGHRDLEYLAAALWERMGYKVVVTPPAKDGGRDVIARQTALGRTETAYIECRQWQDPVSVGSVRSLFGVVTKGHVNRGVLVAPGGFTKGLGSATAEAEEDLIIELVDGVALMTMLTDHFGPDWPVEIDRHITSGERISRRPFSTDVTT